MGLDRVPVRLLDISARKAHALALADNRLGEIARWDEAGLREALAALSAEDRKLAGFAAGLIDGADQPTDGDSDERRLLRSRLTRSRARCTASGDMCSYAAIPPMTP